MAKDKGKGKEVKPLSEAKSLDAASKAKEAETKSKEADPKAIGTPVTQLSSKVDPPPKSKA